MEHILVEHQADITIITMAHARRRNALSEAHLRELDTALEDAAASSARGVIIAAQGPVYSSGHDFGDMIDRDLAAMQTLLGLCREVMQRIPTMPQPVIAQVQGTAMAAGCQLVASADMAVAAASATFVVPGGKGGWFCTTPGVALARAVGRKRAIEMLFTGDPIDAHMAAEWGLVNRVVPDDELVEATMELMRRATRGSAASKAIGKRAFYRQVDLDLARAYDYATEVMASSSQLPAAREKMSAFIEKRRPVFD
ncbi:MAG: enoyl-CoA hydratase-related protein [Acidimicrobiia bacterium]|nr:enoyl-CoA hydratase-related protein [Acidimicrobiia bacterium]